MADINRQALDRCIAVINGKGGVLKTTLVSNVGGLLAASGYRVLIVDLDPQGNLAEDLGYTDDPRNDAGRALASSLLFGGTPDLLEGIRQNLDVLMGGPELDGASAGLSAKQGKNPDGAKLSLAVILEQLAPELRPRSDRLPPGDEMLQTNAVAAARWALVPVKSDKSSRKGLTAVAKRLDGVLDVNPGLDLLAWCSQISTPPQPASSAKLGTTSWSSSVPSRSYSVRRSGIPSRRRLQRGSGASSSRSSTSSPRTGQSGTRFGEARQQRPASPLERRRLLRTTCRRSPRRSSRDSPPPRRSPRGAAGMSDEGRKIGGLAPPRAASPNPPDVSRLIRENRSSAASQVSAPTPQSPELRRAHR